MSYSEKPNFLQITSSQCPNPILSSRNNSQNDLSFIYTNCFLLHFLRTTQWWHKGKKLRFALKLQFSGTKVTIGTFWLYLNRYCRKVKEVLAPPSLRKLCFHFPVSKSPFHDPNPMFPQNTCHSQFLFYTLQDSLVNKICRNSFEILKSK